MFETIVGSYEEGCEVLGATPPKKATTTTPAKGASKPPKKTKPSAIKSTIKKAKLPKSSHSAVALLNAKKALAKASKKISAAKKDVVTYKKDLPTKHVSLAMKAKPKDIIKGILSGDDILGAITVKPDMTPKQKAAVNKHHAALVKHVDATKKLAHSVRKAAKAKAELAKGVNDLQAAMEKISGRKNTKIEGDRLLGELLFDDADFGQELGEAGYFGEDVIAGDDAPPADATADGSGIDGLSDISDASDGDFSALDELEEPLPPEQSGQPLTADEAIVVWHQVPLDGVVYDPATYGWPKFSKGSVTSAYGLQPGSIQEVNVSASPLTGIAVSSGHTEGDMAKPNANGKHQDGMSWGWDDFRIWDDDKDRWLLGKNSPGKLREDSWYDSPAGQDDAAVARWSQANGYGPIVGSPDLSTHKGLQFAVDDGKWFWQASKAPASATAELRAKIDYLKKKKDAYEKKQKDMEAAQTAKQRADEAEAQAQQNAANALAESQEASAAKIAQSQSMSQQAATDQAAQAAAVEQQKQTADLQHQQALQAFEWEKQAAANPAPAPAPQGGGDDGGGGDAGDMDAMSDGAVDAYHANLNAQQQQMDEE